MAWEDSPGIPKGRTDEIWDSSEDQHFVHLSSQSLGRREGIWQELWVIPAGFPLQEVAESAGFVLAEGSVSHPLPSSQGNP